MKDKNSELPEIFFHAGLPKTATTFLQRSVFPKFRDIVFVKKHHFKYHERLVKKSVADRILFSNEYDRNIEEVFQWFSEKYPEARILLSFRPHDRWIESKYRYHLRKNGKLSFEEFCDIENDKGLWNSANMTFMNYVRLAEKYFKYPPFLIFQDNIKNQPFEEFKRIADYVGATFNPDDIPIKIVKKAYNDKQLYCVRKFNRAFDGFDEDRFPPGYRRKLHRKSRALFLHVTAFFGQLVPKRFLPDEALVPGGKLALVREKYKDDWEACKTYAKNTNYAMAK